MFHSLVQLKRNIYSLAVLNITLVTALFYPICVRAQSSLGPDILFPSSSEVNSDLDPNDEFSLEARDSSNYVLGAGDQISIIVIDYDEFNGTRVILPDGTVSIPLLGSLRVAGRTIDDVSRDLTLGLQRYLTNPVVSISLSVLRPVTVTVAGEVYRPGPIQLSSLTSTEETVNTDSTILATTSAPTLSLALASAGGVKRTADVRSLEIQRRLPDGSEETLNINLWESLTSNTIAADLVLRDGDAIYVPAAPEDDRLDQRLLASSTLAPDEVRVRVVGEVNLPGEVRVPPNSTLSSAVAIAGGPTDDARLRKVVLIRLDESGQVLEESIDLRNLIDNVQIQDGDVIWVPKREYLRIFDTIGRVIPSPLSLLSLPQNLVNFLESIGVLGNNRQ